MPAACTRRVLEQIRSRLALPREFLYSASSFGSLEKYRTDAAIAIRDSNLVIIYQQPRLVEFSADARPLVPSIAGLLDAYIRCAPITQLY